LRGGELTADQRTVNTVYAAVWTLAERGHALLKTSFIALRWVRLCPCPHRSGAITAAALVLLHHQHDHTT
jgi:hypothetical protein